MKRSPAITIDDERKPWESWSLTDAALTLGLPVPPADVLGDYGCRKPQS